MDNNYFLPHVYLEHPYILQMVVALKMMMVGNLEANDVRVVQGHHGEAPVSREIPKLKYKGLVEKNGMSYIWAVFVGQELEGENDLFWLGRIAAYSPICTQVVFSHIWATPAHPNLCSPGKNYWSARGGGSPWYRGLEPLPPHR